MATSRLEEIRGAVDKLLIDSVIYSNQAYYYCAQAEALFTIPEPERDEKDWIRLARIYFGKGNHAVNSECAIHYKQAIDSLLHIPFTQFSPFIAELFVKSHYFYYRCAQDNKAVFPTLEAEREYLDTSIKKTVNLPLWNQYFGGNYYARLQKLMANVYIEQHDWPTAKSFINAALHSCKKLLSFSDYFSRNDLKDSIQGIYKELSFISLENTLEKQLYQFAETAMIHLRIRDYNAFLRLHLAITQQPHMQITPVAHALLLMMQILEPMTKRTEQERSFKTLMDKLAADLNVVSLQEMTAKSGGYAVSVASKFVELEKEIYRTQSEFALFAQSIEKNTRAGEMATPSSDNKMVA